MSKPFALVFVLLIALMPVAGFSAVAKKPPPVAKNSAIKTSRPKGTREVVLGLADSYIKQLYPKLQGKDFTSANEIKVFLESQKSSPILLDKAVNDMVSRLTVCLTRLKTLDALVVSSAYLVKYAPENARTSNLFASVLHTAGKMDDAVTVLEYTYQLKPECPLAMMNLANAYLDANENEKAKALLDKVIALDSNNKDAYSALACYWYKKKDNAKTVEALMKAASFGGWVKNKRKKNQELTEKNTSEAGDTTEILEQKANNLKDMVPLTTGDLIEEEYPDMAQKFRDKYQKLLASERMVLPLLPQMNTSSLRDFQQNSPIIEAWAEVIGERAETGIKEVVYLQTGITSADSDAVMRKKALKTANEQMNKAMADSEKMLKAMKGMPGIKPEEIARLQRELNQAKKDAQQEMKKEGIQLPKDQSGDADDGDSADSADSENTVATADMPGFDSGSIFAAQNYHDYMITKNIYEMYMKHYFKDYNAKVNAILESYGKKMKEEADDHDATAKQLNEEEKRAADGIPEDEVALRMEVQEKYARAHRREDLRHKKKVNSYGDDYYSQYVNLYMPQYTQKMRPMLHNYWNVCALYVRNIQNPDLMKQEYGRIVTTYWTNAGQATGGASLCNSFTYLGETEEEEKQLEEDIKAAEKMAEARRNGFDNETKSPKDVVPGWLADNLEFSVALEFLALKISTKGVEFEAYVPGVNGTVTYDFESQSFKTSTSLCAKIDIGMKIGPLDMKLEGRADLLESHDTFYVNKTQVDEGSSFAKANLKYSLGPASVEGTVVIDPAVYNTVSGSVVNAALGQSKTYSFGTSP